MKSLLFLLSCLLLVAGKSVAYTVPPSFGNPVQSDVGVALYVNGSHKVLAIQADLGGRVVLPHGSVVSGSGNPGYEYVHIQSVSTFWNNLNNTESNAFAVTNGTFFGIRPGFPDQAGVAFPLKVDGDVVAYGYAACCWENKLKALQIWDNKFRIDAIGCNAVDVDALSAPNVIGGLIETANCATSTSGGCSGETQCKGGATKRTFVGCADPLGNGDYATLLILTTDVSISGPQAGDILRSFDAEPTMMLDGGGSTQMICNGAQYTFGDGRSFNTAIGVLGAEPYKCLRQSPMVVDLYGQPGQTLAGIYALYKNVGSENWTNNNNVSDPHSVELWACNSAGSIENSWFENVGWIGCPSACSSQRVTGADQSTVTPGQTGKFTFDAKIPSSATAGDHPVYFRLTHGGQLMDDWGSFHFVVHVNIPGPCGPLLPSWNPSVSASMQSLAVVENGATLLDDQQLQRCLTTGQSVVELLQPATVYRIGFEYQSDVEDDLQLSIISANKQYVLDSVHLVSTPGQWHPFWSRSFTVTAEQLSVSSMLRFAFADGVGDGVEVRNVLIWSTNN